MVDPGLVSITHWQPDTVSVGRVEPIDAYGAVGRSRSAAASCGVSKPG